LSAYRSPRPAHSLSRSYLIIKSKRVIGKAGHRFAAAGPYGFLRIHRL